MPIARPSRWRRNGRIDEPAVPARSRPTRRGEPATAGEDDPRTPRKRPAEDAADRRQVPLSRQPNRRRLPTGAPRRQPLTRTRAPRPTCTVGGRTAGRRRGCRGTGEAKSLLHAAAEPAGLEQRWLPADEAAPGRRRPAAGSQTAEAERAVDSRLPRSPAGDSQSPADEPAPSVRRARGSGDSADRDAPTAMHPTAMHLSKRPPLMTGTKAEAGGSDDRMSPTTTGRRRRQRRHRRQRRRRTDEDDSSPSPAARGRRRRRGGGGEGADDGRPASQLPSPAPTRCDRTVGQPVRPERGRDLADHERRHGRRIDRGRRERVRRIVRRGRRSAPSPPAPSARGARTAAPRRTTRPRSWSGSVSRVAAARRAERPGHRDRRLDPDGGQASAPPGRPRSRPSPGADPERGRVPGPPRVGRPDDDRPAARRI